MSSYVLQVSEPFGENEKPKLDPSDPRVRKLVYSMYRDMLSNRNNEANEFISQKDPSCVKQDLGIVPILESIIRQGSTGSGETTPVSPPPPPPLPSANGTKGIPPPPPPMGPTGSLPAVRLNSEVGPITKGPPKQIQGAMMKDKKPFTYTPGGIDLFSEIRSPRMAKRIQMNAAAEGVTSTPAPHAHPNGPAQAGNQNHPHPHLPPAALAAMQPQLPIAVFPQGGFPQGNLHRTVRPNDFPVMTQSSPPPFQNQSSPTNYQSPQSPFAQTTFIPPPPPPPPQQHRQNATLEHELRQGLAPREAPKRPTSPRPPPMSLAAVMNQSIRAPPPDEDSQVQSHQTEDHHVSLLPQEQTKSKAQAVSQQIGSIYIPSAPTGVAAFGDRSQPPQMNTNVKKSGLGNEADADGDKGTGNINSRPSSASSTTQLNKAPTPWLHSQNRVAQQPSPPYVTKPSGNTTPWGPPMTTPRAVPVNMKRDAGDGEVTIPAPAQPTMEGTQSQTGKPFTSHIQMQLNRNNPVVVEQHLEPPSQSQRYSAQGNSPTPTGTRIIPISIQGQAPQQQLPPARPQTVYSSPRGLFSGGHIPGAMQPQRSENTDLNEELNKVKIPSEEGYRTIPIQSKSFKVIQRITADEEKAEHQKLELKGEDKELMDSVKAKVDDSSLHQSTEPRFRGGHIPSRTFQALRSHLPPSPDPNHEFPVYPAKTGPVTHNIQIQMAPTSPLATFQQHRTPMETQGQLNSATSQHHPEFRRYAADANIPSRSFKFLQTMTPNASSPYDGLGSALEGSSPAGIIQTDNNPNHVPLSSQSHPPPPSSQNGHVHDTNIYDNSVDKESNVTGNALEEGPANAQDPNWDAYWYYYWYWANYWNSLGYECPPEGWEAYCQTPTQEIGTTVSIPSKMFKNLQRAYDDDGLNGPETRGDCDNVQIETEKLKYVGKKMEDCTVPYDDKTFRSNRLGSIAEDENEETNQEPPTEQDGPSDVETSSLIGVVEELAETPTSSISEDEVVSLPSQHVFIRECRSESESESEHHRNDRLSTIDELSETERGISSLASLESDTDETDHIPESDDDDTSDQRSTTSVIENGSVDTFDEDGTTTPRDESCSSESSSEGEDAEVESTYTVRLPLKRSFTKSKSYRDIATVFVGINEVHDHSALEEDEEDEVTTGLEEAENTQEIEEDASCTANLSTTSESAPEVIEQESEIDFWGEIIGTNTEDTSSRRVETWEVTAQTKLTEEEPLNFWDKPEPVVPKLNLLRNHGQFELTESYMNEQWNSTKGFLDDFVQTKSDKGSEKVQIPEGTTFQQPIQETTGRDSDGQSSCETDIENSGSNGFRLSEDSRVSLLSASDETSDESSSKSSSATVTGNSSKSMKLSLRSEPENALNSELLRDGTEPKGLETNEMEETEKINQKKEASSPISKSRGDVEEPNPCTCQTVVGRVAKAENLLWRIERFLQQSFTSLGSEEDSGVMTDQSTQMSDAETDNDEGSTQGLSHKLSSSFSTPEVIEDSKTTAAMTETQRQALSYQRAKTHSRLFELLQEECIKEDEEEEEGVGTVNNDREGVENSTAVKAYPKTLLSPVPDKKRFLPNSDSGSLSFDSSGGSLSGSSGLLSPMNRDQILVDIIHQFQSRQKKECQSREEGIGSQRRLSSTIFPSKIFKMLHDEFGEEFYDAFDLSEEEFCQIPILTDHCQTESKLGENHDLNTANLSNGKKKRNSKHKIENMGDQSLVHS